MCLHAVLPGKFFNLNYDYGESLDTKQNQTFIRRCLAVIFLIIETIHAKTPAGQKNPNASRAVGTAIGDNPVAFLIPCHRVIRSTGDFGQYHWGSVRKAAIIGWEAAKIDPEN